MFNAAEASLAEASLEEVSEQKSDSARNPGFTLVTTAIQTTIRSNSLYQLVTDLLSQDLPCEVEMKKLGIKESLEPSLLADYRVEALTDDKAWLIHLDQKPENVLYSETGFEFQGSHLRVDALFAKANTLKAKQGFSACHYTTEYKNPHTNELIIVHTYIGKNGIISYQIRKYKSEDDREKGIGEDLPINSILKEKIRKNAEPAVTLAKKLYKEKHTRYIEAEKKSYEIETKLNALLQKILINSTQSGNRLVLKIEYGVLVNYFLGLVEIINRYNDEEIDQRGVLLQQFYALMNRPVVAAKTVESKEVSESQAESADLLENMQVTDAEENLSIKVKSKEELQLEEDAVRAIVLVTEIKALMKTLKRLIAKQSALKTDELILRQTLIEDVNLKLIELAFLSGVTPENNNYLEKVATLLNNIPVLLEVFKQAVEQGELDRVMQLHPHVQHENLIPIFHDLIFEKLIKSSGEELNKIIAIAEFFFENSNHYREFMNLCDQLVISIVGFDCSLLFNAFFWDNYLAFELMLNQGFNPNGMGLVCEEVTASVINSITYFMGTATSKFTDTRYIKALLSFGALVENKTPNVASKIAEGFHSIVEQKKVEKFLKKSKMRIGSTTQNAPFQTEEEDFDSLRFKKMLSFDSALKLLCFMDQLPKLELLELLVPESSLSSLVAALVSLTNVVDVRTRLVIGTKEPYFIGCFDVMQANKMNAALLSPGEGNLFEEVSSQGSCAASDLMHKKHVTCIAYHTNPARAVIWCKNLNPLIKALCEKYHEVFEQDPVQIAKLDVFLINKAKASEDLGDKTNFLQAALYLQLFNAEFSFQNAEKIVQTLCHLGQAYFHHRLFDSVSRVRSESNFMNALLCCTTLECSEALQATSLFNFIKKKLFLLGALPERFQVKKDQTITVHVSDTPDSKQFVGNPLTLAAQNHAKQTPSLTALANGETKSAPIAAETPGVAPAEETPKGKKKKKKKR